LIFYKNKAWLLEKFSWIRFFIYR